MTRFCKTNQKFKLSVQNNDQNCCQENKFVKSMTYSKGESNSYWHCHSEVVCGKYLVLILKVANKRYIKNRTY